MKRLALVTAVAAFVLLVAWDEPGFWVIKDSKLPTCSVVTQNPVVDGTIQWASGPYASQKDAELAITTIDECKPSR